MSVETINFEQYEKMLSELPLDEIKPITNTIAHVFNKDTAENFISDWLAYLLDPSKFGNDEPLSKLLFLAEAENEITENSGLTITREYVFDDGRRIDFFIESDDLIIGIENKIWSGLQENQLSDYEKSIDRLTASNKNIVLILLYPNSNSYMPHNDKELFGFKKITYESFCSELKKIRPNFIENLRSAFLLEDFITHMEEHIMNIDNDKNKNLLFLDFYNQNKETIKNLKNNEISASDWLREKIKEVFIRVQDNEETWAINSKKTYIQLYKTSWLSKSVHFEVLYCNSEDQNDTTSSIPSYLCVTLHTHEWSKENKGTKTKKLIDLGKEVEKKYNYGFIKIEYSKEGFEITLKKVEETLSNMVKEYTPEIDIEIIKNPQ